MKKIFFLCLLLLSSKLYALEDSLEVSFSQRRTLSRGNLIRDIIPESWPEPQRGFFTHQLENPSIAQELLNLLGLTVRELKDDRRVLVFLGFLKFIEFKKHNKPFPFLILDSDDGDLTNKDILSSIATTFESFWDTIDDDQDPDSYVRLLENFERDQIISKPPFTSKFANFPRPLPSPAGDKSFLKKHLVEGIPSVSNFGTRFGVILRQTPQGFFLTQKALVNESSARSSSSIASAPVASMQRTRILEHRENTTQSADGSSPASKSFRALIEKIDTLPDSPKVVLVSSDSSPRSQDLGFGDSTLQKRKIQEEDPEQFSPGRRFGVTLRKVVSQKP